MMNPLTWLSLKEWIFVGAVAIVSGWHFYDRHEAVKAAVADQDQKIELEKAQAVAAAEKDWHERSTKLDMLTYLDNQQFTATMSQLSANLANFKGVYHETVIHDPLPPGCVASPDRVRAVNQAFTGAKP
jgi:hypothetical protein